MAAFAPAVPSAWGALSQPDPFARSGPRTNISPCSGLPDHWTPSSSSAGPTSVRQVLHAAYVHLLAFQATHLRVRGQDLLYPLVVQDGVNVSPEDEVI